MNYGELLNFVAPETLVVLAAFGALLFDMMAMRGSTLRKRMRAAAWLSLLGCGAAALAILHTPQTTPPGYLDGMLVLNPLAHLVKLVLLGLTAFTVLLSVESTFTDHVGEYFALLLLATVGMMFLVSTENILLIFVSLELLSLCLYIMTAFKKESIQSSEAALKYFLFGGMSAAFMLFGLSLVYGLAGELHLTKIALALQGQPLDALRLVAIVMVVIGLGFKIAAVPFHLWAPDAYEGAPTPTAAFIASGSKVASFFILAKVMMVGFAAAPGAGNGGWSNYSQVWIPLIAAVAALSIVLGNVAAIVQNSVRRLLAYSAIAQAGYMLIGLLADTQQGMASLLYYVCTYALTTLGAFGVVAVVEDGSGSEKFSAFAGLGKRSPLLSFCMLVFLLSLAGIPPLAGFFGKVYLFAAMLNSTPKELRLLWLVILAIGMSAISLYYYLQVLKQIYVVEATAPASALPLARSASLAIGLLAGGVIVLGCAPNLLLSRLLAALQASGL